MSAMQDAVDAVVASGLSDDQKPAVIAQCLKPEVVNLILATPHALRLGLFQQLIIASSPDTAPNVISPSPSPSLSLSLSAIMRQYPPINRPRTSYPIKPEQSFETLSQVEFPQRLPFVSRTDQCTELVTNFAEAYTRAKSKDGSSSDDAILKNYRMVVVAGGPGIGKTTFARYAFAHAGSCSSVNSSNEEFYRSLQDTHKCQAMFRIVYGHILEWERLQPLRSIAARLLYELIKHRVRDKVPNSSWESFSTQHRLDICADVTLTSVVDLILPFKQDGPKRVIVLNFDEVSTTLENDKSFIQSILQSLVTFGTCFFCITLTSTMALEVLHLPTSSGIGCTSISLPLLEIVNMYEVVQHITKLCATARPDRPDDSSSSIVRLILENEAVNLPTAPLLRNFTYLLELLAGVPRFVEKALFMMGCTPGSQEFRPEIFLHNLNAAGNPQFVFKNLLQSVVHAIMTQYWLFNNYLSRLELFPLLITCSMFQAQFFRSQRIQYESSDREIRISHLEDSGVIFLAKTPTLSQPTPHSLPLTQPKDALWSAGSKLLRPWRTRAAADDEEAFCIVVPFIWLHLVAARASMDVSPRSPLPQVQLLSQLGMALTSSQKERLSISVLALRMYYLAECDQVGHGKNMRFQVSDLFPISSLHARPTFTHVDMPDGFSWKVIQSTSPITASTFESLQQQQQQQQQHPLLPSQSQSQPQSQSQELIVFLQNKDKTKSADSFVLCKPLIAIQDKQSHAFKLAVQSGQKGGTVSVNAIKKERAKFQHECLFVFITDERVPHSDPESDEAVIDASNEKNFYGPFLSRLKLFHDKDESVEFIDPTAAIQLWMSQPASHAPSAATSVASSAVSAPVDNDTESNRPDVFQMEHLSLAMGSRHTARGGKRKRA